MNLSPDRLATSRVDRIASGGANCPPVTMSVAPEIQAASLEDRKTAAPATSSGSPIRFNGMSAAWSAYPASVAKSRDTAAVLMIAGAMAFTRIPNEPYSVAIVSVMLTRAAFAAA